MYAIITYEMSSSSFATIDNSLYSEEGFALINQQVLPRHVAIVMDGNRRWAINNGKSIEAGHWQGAEQLDLILRAARELKIKILTVYSFSTENWKRTEEEIHILMQLLETYLSEKRADLIREGVRVHTIGDLSPLPLHIQRHLEETKQATQGCNEIELILALNYGGRDEMRRAFIRMSEEVKKGALKCTEITEETISSYLDTAQWPDPELLIRSGGAQRISNFLIWQISYSEIVITDTLWPDFSPKDLLQAIIEYQKRQRRFGG